MFMFIYCRNKSPCHKVVYGRGLDSGKLPHGRKKFPHQFSYLPKYLIPVFFTFIGMNSSDNILPGRDNNGIFGDLRPHTFGPKGVRGVSPRGGHLVWRSMAVAIPILLLPAESEFRHNDCFDF